MKVSISAAVLIAYLSIPNIFFGQNTASASLLVLSKRDHTLGIVDPRSLQVLAKVPVGNDPHEVIASSDGNAVYVSNYGFRAYNTLAVVDLVAGKALLPIDLGPLPGPHGLVLVGGRRGLLGWRQGLDKKLKQARAFYTLILLSTGMGVGLNFAGINPVKALYWTAVINGLLAPFLLIAILIVASDKN